MNSQSPLTSSVAIVTGAASGIGRASAIKISQCGATVALLDVDTEGLERTGSEIGNAGGSYDVFPIDLSDSRSIAPVVTAVLGRFGYADILVNAAGLGSEVTLLEMDEPGWDLIFAINLKAPALLMQHVGRAMIERGQGGKIVNVASSSAFRGQAPAAYASSKGGLVALTRVAAFEFGAHNINVNTVAPGVTVSSMTLRARSREQLDDMAKQGPVANYFGRVAEPDDVAAAITFLCLPDSRQITGQVIHTSAGAVV